MSEDNGIMQGMKEAGIFAMFKDVSIDRIIELASAEREGRVVVIPYKWLYERIGDYAYMVDDEVIEVIICSVSLDANGTLFVGVASNDGSEFYTEFESVEVTTRLFETRAKAERALAATEPTGGLDGK